MSEIYLSKHGAFDNINVLCLVIKHVFLLKQEKNGYKMCGKIVMLNIYLSKHGAFDNINALKLVIKSVYLLKQENNYAKCVEKYSF